MSRVALGAQRPFFFTPLLPYPTVLPPVHIRVFKLGATPMKRVFFVILPTLARALPAFHREFRGNAQGTIASFFKPTHVAFNAWHMVMAANHPRA